MMKKLALLFAGLVLVSVSATVAQTPGISIPGLPGASGASGADLIPIDQAVTPSPAHPNGRATRSAPLSLIASPTLDSIGATRGSVLERGVSGWQVIAPGTAGLPWVSNGAAADPAYQLLTNAGLAAMAANTVKGSIAGGTPADLNAPFMSGGTQGQVLTKNSSTAGDATWRDQCLNIEAFGGVGDGVTNNVTAWSAATAALPAAGGCIFFPPGKYSFGAGITYTLAASGKAGITILGAGSGHTTLFWPAGGGLSITYGSIQSAAHIRDLSLTTGTTATGTAITLTYATSNSNPAVTAQSDISNVVISGDDGLAATDYWSTAINVANVSNVNFPGVAIVGSSGRLGTGINLVGLPGSSTYAVGFNVTSANIGNLQQGIVYNSFVQGLEVNASNLIGNQTGILAPSAATGTLTSLLVTNTNLDNTQSDINFQAQMGGASINGNAFFVNFNSVNGLVGNCVSCSITGNTFLGTTTTSTAGINFTSGAANNIISGNVIQGVSVGVQFQAGANNNILEANTYNSNTTNITNSGTGNSGLDLPSQSYTPSSSCGSATFTTNSAKFERAGKRTWLQLDQTITALGTCTNTLTFTLPNTPATSATLHGVNLGTSASLLCTLAAGSATATCHPAQNGGANFTAANLIWSGVYENQ